MNRPNPKTKSQTWSPENIALLGTAADHYLAQIWKITTAEICAKREELDIQKYHRSRIAKYSWKPKDVALLGKMTDAAVAEKLGTVVSQVEKERTSRRISAYKIKVTLHEWSPADDSLVGKKSDIELGLELGISRETVAARRKKLGIPRQRGSGSKQGGHVERTHEQIWTPDMVAKLGKVSDSDLAAVLKIHSREARAERERRNIPRLTPKHPFTREWTPEELALIGTLSDTDIAVKLGVSRSQVLNRRKAMGLGRFLPKKAERAWLPEEDALIGVQTDIQIAVALAISKTIVSKRRRQLGIPSGNGHRPTTS